MGNHQCFCILKLLFSLFMIMWNEKGGAFAAQGKRRNKHVHLFVSIGDKSMSLLPTGNITKKETRKNKEVRGW